MPKKTPPPPSYLADLHSFDYDAFFDRCWRDEATADDEQQYALRLASCFVACGEQGKPVPEWLMIEIRGRLSRWVAGEPIADCFYLPGAMPQKKTPRSSDLVRAVTELRAAHPDMKIGDVLDAVAKQFHVERVTVEKAFYAPKPWKSHTFLPSKE